MECSCRKELRDVLISCPCFWSFQSYRVRTASSKGSPAHRAATGARNTRSPELSVLRVWTKPQVRLLLVQDVTLLSPSLWASEASVEEKRLSLPCSLLVQESVVLYFLLHVLSDSLPLTQGNRCQQLVLPPGACLRS